MKNLILCLIILAGLGACKNKKQITASQNMNYTINNKDTLAHLSIIESISTPEVAFKYTIKKAAIDGDLLKIDIQYSGGCEDQTFMLVSDGINNEGKVKLQLMHDSKGDLCKKLIMKTLYFNLSPLGEKDENRILSLNQFRGVLKY